MVSTLYNPPRPLPFKFPIYQNPRRSYTSSDFVHEVHRLIDRDITDSFCLIIGYIGEFEEVDDHRSGKIVIQLNGRLALLYLSNVLVS